MSRSCGSIVRSTRSDSTTSSGVATQVAPLADQNDVLFISGPAATDAVTTPTSEIPTSRRTW